MLRDKPNIIVSTPAGLLMQIQRDNKNSSNGSGSGLNMSLRKSVESLVVDEADLVLSFGEFYDVCYMLNVECYITLCGMTICFVVMKCRMV